MTGKCHRILRCLDSLDSLDSLDATSPRFDGNGGRLSRQTSRPRVMAHGKLAYRRKDIRPRMPRREHLSGLLHRLAGQRLQQLGAIRIREMGLQQRGNRERNMPTRQPLEERRKTPHQARHLDAPIRLVLTHPEPRHAVREQ